MCRNLQVFGVEMAGHAPWSAERATDLIGERRHLPGACIPILHALQDEFGHIPAEAVGMVAEALNLSRAEVHGVVTFYHDFRTTPPGRRVVKLCRAEACQSVGVEALAETLSRELGIGFGETTADGAVTLETVYCLGNCACGPAALVDGELHGRLDAARLRALIAGGADA
jgi:formate dehydrogenase subunit gamma